MCVCARAPVHVLLVYDFLSQTLWYDMCASEGAAMNQGPRQCISESVAKVHPEDVGDGKKNGWSFSIPEPKVQVDLGFLQADGRSFEPRGSRFSTG